MKKSTIWALIAVLAIATAGCAKKTASEQLRDDMKKAGKEMNKEVASWGK